jgi:hypothetical protein
LRFFCKAGNATLTTVPSIKAMLEPRMVAARIHGSETGARKTPAGRARITPSSHGCGKALAISKELQPIKNSVELQSFQPFQPFQTCKNFQTVEDV